MKPVPAASDRETLAHIRSPAQAGAQGLGRRTMRFQHPAFAGERATHLLDPDNRR